MAEKKKTAAAAPMGAAGGAKGAKAGKVPGAEKKAAQGQERALTAVVSLHGAFSYLNLRLRPGLDAPAVASMPEGERVSVRGTNADSTWVHVMRTDGTEGWAMAAYLFPLPVEK